MRWLSRSPIIGSLWPIARGDELRVADVGRAAGAVMLAGKECARVAWEPDRVAARAGGVEVYRTESMEIRAGDRIRWTRNDPGLGLVNGQTAEVTAVSNGRVGFRLEGGRMLNMNAGGPQGQDRHRAGLGLCPRRQAVRRSGPAGGSVPLFPDPVGRPPGRAFAQVRRHPAGRRLRRI